jgi:nucleoside-diphosphate-sugar epimerase
LRSLFITGATGFIGRHFLQALDPKHYRHVVCLGRALGAPAALPGIRFLRGDLRDQDSYLEELATCDTVVHLAAATGRASRQEFREINAEGTRSLVHQSQRLGVRDFLFISTIAVKYPDKRHYPYAETKELGEKALRESSLRYAVIRPTIVMGREAPIWRSLSGLARRRLIVMPGNGRARIQPVHVDDLVAGLIALLQAADLFARGTFEVGGPDVVTFEDFLRRIHRIRSGGEARVLHLPLGPLVTTLSLLEGPLGGALPVTAGQFSAFGNDSTADPGLALPVAAARAMGVDDIIRECLSGA